MTDVPVPSYRVRPSDDGGPPWRMLAIGGGIAGALVVGGALAWGIMRVSGPRSVPVIEADPRPFKVRPDDPGGLRVPNQDELIFERSRGSSAQPPGARLAPEPEAPSIDALRAQVAQPSRPAAPAESILAPQAPAPPVIENKPATPEQVTPSMTSPTPIGRQSQNNAAPAPATNPGNSASVEIPVAPAAAVPPPTSSDITGALSGTSRAKLGVIQVPPSEKLPDGIGGPALRSAAMKGDPTAAYEIGLRFAEGKGVATNYDEAAKWYDRAAQAGVVPATFRLGTLYEKGLGVKKDADIARRYYTQAAERGNAKAMHNLAVLDADGGGRGANYKSAAQWFRKAADRGVADSQFNLGILYARGIGVEQNLAESYKWFSLAAAQGDADAAGKRDDVAKRLDPQSLAAAKLAIQTFAAEPQPDDAVNVPAPNGGWDSAPQASAKPAPKPVAAKRSASAAH